MSDSMPYKTRSRSELPAAVVEAYAYCEERLQSHDSHLLRAARTLTDERRRNAFFACYLSLRVQAPACLPRPLGRSRSVHASLQSLRGWRDTARLCYQRQHQEDAPGELALADAMERFEIPMTPWINLEEGLADLARNEPVRTLPQFFSRARNLAVAPSSVFVRILCSHEGVRRYRMAKELDVHELSHDPAAFAYIVGVIVDVFKELDERRHQQSSVPLDLLQRHHLTRDDLRALSTEKQAPDRFLSLMQDMSLFAWKFYESGVAKLTQAAAQIPSQGIHHLDGFLDQYKVILKGLERVEFSPVEFSHLSGTMDHRITLGMQGADLTQDGV